MSPRSSYHHLMRLSCIGVFIGASALARAEVIQVIGASLRVYNPDGPQVVSVQATFLGDSSSLYTNELYLDAPTFLGPIFNNHLTPLNYTVSLGTFQPETVLFIRNRSFFLSNPNDPNSPASYNFNFFTGDGTLPPNPDRLPHAVFSFDTDDSGGPVTVSFEDQLGGGDLDFNDAIYSFTNVRAAMVDVAVTPLVAVNESKVLAPFRDYYSNNNSDTVQNFGSIINYGDADNSGLLSNRPGGSLFNDMPGTLFNTFGGRIDNAGTFGTFGNLTNDTGGEIRNSGSINNAGGFDNLGSLINEATDEATGTIRNLFTGVINNQGSIANSGTIQNLGSLLNQETGTVTNSVGGLIENLAGGAVVNLGAILNNVGGTIENSGTIENQGNLQNLGSLLNKATSIINNVSGTISNLGSLVNQAGGSVVNSSSVTNSGTIQNLGSLLNQETGTLTNSIGGLIENLAGGTVVNLGAILNSAGAIIENSGTIEHQGNLQNLGTLLNKANASINNASGAIQNLGKVLINAQSSLSGNGTYLQSGGVTVVDGKLGASSIDISGGVLSGSGILEGDVRIGPEGTLAPGNSPGTLQILGDFRLEGGRLEIELAALTLHDLLDISGSAIFDGGFIDYLFSFTPIAGDSFVFLTATDGITGLDTLSFRFFGDLDGLRFVTRHVGDSLVLLAERGQASVPEAGVLWLMALGLLILAVDARRRGRRPKG